MATGLRIIAGYSTSTGQLLWRPLNQTEVPWVRLDASEIKMIVVFSLTMKYGSEQIDANTGQRLWTSDPSNSPPWAYFVNYNPVVASSIVYASDFGGQVHAYDITTGKNKLYGQCKTAVKSIFNTLRHMAPCSR